MAFSKAQKSKPYLVRVWGDWACFTGPSKMERDSYPVITPSAARGVLDSILWKPAIRWVIHRVFVVNPIKYATMRRIELTSRSPKPDGTFNRDLRMTRALRNVEYIVEASFYMTDLAGPDDNLRKFTDMFERRMSKGQTYRDPFLGCREFPANVELFAGNPFEAANPNVDLDAGIMIYDFKSRDSCDYLTFHADIKQGVMVVPSPEEVPC